MHLVFPRNQCITPTPLDILWWCLRVRLMLKHPLLEVARNNMCLAIRAIEIHIASIWRNADMSKRANIQEPIFAVCSINYIDGLVDA